ncbi:MAG: M48 family metalloprotease [bacterium]
MADREGARIHGNPRHPVQVLRKLQRGVERDPMEANPATAHMFIVNPLWAGGGMRLFSTHPPIEERIRQLEQIDIWKWRKTDGKNREKKHHPSLYPAQSRG